ncbi:tripartite tricarboxylate transporter substrate binding protein [Comamonas sp. Y33R10-2]|uniref:Bug family tripartite tricarboxylate transporter substrate binding protein n=1 Tax=Comamonas sp. Y33R10-2 TaxID=2853257 RepID=UPI001C5CB35C|nr:tripartite tricarboxylate transporter substrate binding protein [Comamonas sp. Y33R10-2]QXZ10274.1 tripartite tricarboxylate transporter substrate binding protein [Comamonas sp. Y33R10-2]
MHTITRRSLAVAASLAALTFTVAAHAADFPERSITVVVPYSPAGGVDIITRLVTTAMAQNLNQSIVVDNKPGGGTNIGMQTVARSAPDGYTLLTASNTLTTNKALYNKLSYDPDTAFEYIGRIAEAALVVVVNTNSPIKTLDELVKAGKSKPEALSFGTAGVGSSGHMASEQLMASGGFKGVHVPYKGGSAAVTDLLGGRLDFMTINPLEVTGHIAAGKLRPLAVLNDAGSRLLPQVKTAKSQGYDVNATVWWGLTAPAGTPAAVIATLNQSLNKAVASPEVQKKLGEIGASPMTGTPAQFAQFVKKESSELGKLIKTAGIKAD